MRLNFLAPEFLVHIDADRCTGCGRCARECSYDALHMPEGYQPRAKVLAQLRADNGPVSTLLMEREIASRWLPIPDNAKCCACMRCVATCPEECIYIYEYPYPHRGNTHWTVRLNQNVVRQARAGAKLLTSMGSGLPIPILWDHLLLNAAQVTNPSIDPLREPMELRTYLGRRPERLDVTYDAQSGRFAMCTPRPPLVKLDIPITIASMSYGAVSFNVHHACMRAAQKAGTIMFTGEGGCHPDLRRYGEHLAIQVASGRFGVNTEYLQLGAAIEIKIGQGAKPGIGGHLPGEKVSEDIARTRGIPVGTDALSPAPHHDIYSIEDLAQLIYALKEATHFRKPVGVKIAAVHNSAAIASGMVRAVADFITLDGLRGSTGAAPLMLRDYLGIPIELAIATVDQRLRAEGLRHQVSVIATGGVRCSADVVKAIALGADAVQIGTAVLMAIGCTACQRCHTGNCAWGLATQRPELVKRVKVETATENIYNLLRGWSLEIKEMLGAMGLNCVESLVGNREHLRAIGLDEATREALGVKAAGR